MSHTPELDRKSLLLSLIFILILLLISGGMSLYILTDKSVEQALKLITAALKIEENYHADVDMNQLIVSAREEIFNRLDRYSSYYKDEQFEQMDIELSGSYSGIGVSVIQNEKGLLIMSVREDGPAFSAGLYSGDIIVEVDSTELTDMTTAEAIRFLKGEEKTEVYLRIYRPVTDVYFDVSVIREKMSFIHIPFAGFTSDSLIYIRLLDFDAGASEDLEQVLDSLISNNTKGIILDLRNNPGGLFSEGYKIANLFLEDNILIVGTDARTRWRENRYYSDGKDITNNIPLALIVNKGSASASEIVAGALQQANRAILVGDTTFGTGPVQGFITFPYGDGLKLTVSRYYFDGNIFLNDFDSALIDTGHGLIPDYFYDDKINNYFLFELENSFILRDFATEYQDEIIEAVQSGQLDNIWIDKLIKYTQQKDKIIKSKQTLAAEDLNLVAQYVKSDSKTKKTIDNIISISKKSDITNYYENSEYITYRLARLAYQRKLGTYEMYKQVVLNQQTIIKIASDILLENN